MTWLELITCAFVWFAFSLFHDMETRNGNRIKAGFHYVMMILILVYAFVRAVQ